MARRKVGLWPHVDDNNIAHLQAPRELIAARSVGIYRLWRDAGFAIGAISPGLLADLVSLEAAIYAVATLTALSGLVVWVRQPRS